MSLPHVPRAPAVWQVLHWIARPISFMRSCASRYGDSFTVPLGTNMAPVVFFSHPQALQTILTNDDSGAFDASGGLNVLFEPFLGTQSVIGLTASRVPVARY